MIEKPKGEENMLKLRYKIGIVLAVLGGMFLLGRCSHKKAPSAASAILPSGDIEQIRVNPETHQITIQTPTGTHTVALPDRTSTIDVLKDGQVKVTSPQFGFERHLFLGYTISDAGRFGVGMDGYYWKKLDVGLGVADQFGGHTPIVFAKLTYNIKGSLQLGVTYGSNQTIGGMLSVRLF